VTPGPDELGPRPPVSHLEKLGAHPETTSSRRVHDGWLGFRVDSLRYASGREGTIDVVEHPGGITLVAVTDDEQLLFVRQYRHPLGKDLLELPAGTLDPDESPEVAAERELQEETGYRPRVIKELGGFYSAPGYCTEYLHVYLCTELEESRLEGDEDEIVCERVSLDGALRMVETGEIQDAKSVAALLMYMRFRASA